MHKYLDLENEIDYAKLKEPAEAIKNGKIVVFPTETVYGIGTNGLDGNAIKRLYEVKQRPFDKPISLLVNNIQMIDELATDITDLEYTLINTFLPGPMTIILKKKSIVPNILTANLDTVGIRIPENKIALKLIELSEVPIATPSANITGSPSGTDMSKIINDFSDKVDYFINGGTSKIGLASTIVKVIDGTPHILRQGSISEEQIMSVCRR